MKERLQKIIANAGITSRRKAEKLIEDGRVTVNGDVARIGQKADPNEDHIKVNNKLINNQIAKQRKTYIVLNKPKGVLSAVSDHEGRKTVTDFVKGYGRLYPVGRLDFNTEGIIFLTNDGDFSNRVASKKKFKKIYEVKVKGLPNRNAINKIARGVELEDGYKTAPAEIKPLRDTKKNAWFEVGLYEGHNRQIRQMFDLIGYSVVKLKRIQIGDFKARELAVGEYRELTESELKSFG